MRQLAEEIHKACGRNDLGLASRASALLAPTLSQWRSAPDLSEPAARTEAARLAREARSLLDESTEAMTRFRDHAGRQLVRLRQSRRLLHNLRKRRSSPAPRRIDIRY